jgi:hypothetical protein
MTQASLFPASELEPAPPRPPHRLTRLKTLLLAIDGRRKNAHRAVKPDEARDEPRRTGLWLDSFFDH